MSLRPRFIGGSNLGREGGCVYLRSGGAPDTHGGGSHRGLPVGKPFRLGKKADRFKNLSLHLTFGLKS